MKVVIVGGGIAGLTLGIYLTQKNVDVIINERQTSTPSNGHAFLMHTEAINVLKGIDQKMNTLSLGKGVNTFSLRRPSGKEIMHLQLDSWKCIKRVDLIKFLTDKLPADKIKSNRSFSHFIYERGRVIAAVFQNGETEYGDVFIGADGANSKVRNELFGEPVFSEVAVKEIVGMVRNEKFAQQAREAFIKFQDKTKGLAFGFIATSNDEIVWFIQYDTRINDLENSTAETLRKFCLDLLVDFPLMVKEIMYHNDFSTSYIWNAKDMDLLPAFHKANAVLIGDAAHLSLPFTSAGTTNAILDAKTICDVLTEVDGHEKAFEIYYQERSKKVAEHTTLGRELKNIFLNPKSYGDDRLRLPLISQKRRTVGDDPKEKSIKVLYFTDPICSTCWIIQPLLLKLKLEYDNYLDMNYLMGGMLPSWGEYTKGKIGNPADAAKHWDEVSAEYEMPLNGDIWIEDPLNSSYPPSIAFKAAQMQDNYMALLFLRRIKEMVFVEKKNIIKWEFLEKAAFESGLDTARLLRDYTGAALSSFNQDLIKKKECGVTSFPTLIFSDNENNQVSYTLKGYQPYERIEEIIYSIIPDAKKKVIDTNPEMLFSHYPTMAEKEFAYLSDLPQDKASIVLNDLHSNGKLTKIESKNGTLWKSRFNEV